MKKTGKLEKELTEEEEVEEEVICLLIVELLGVALIYYNIITIDKI